MKENSTRILDSDFIRTSCSILFQSGSFFFLVFLFMELNDSWSQTLTEHD